MRHNRSSGRRRCLGLALFFAAAVAGPFAPASAQTPGARPPGPDVPGLKGAGKPLTSDTGRPVGDNANSMTVGPEGPTLLQDFHLLEKLARFDRERIPERVVHARGVGVHGTFVCNAPMTAYTKAAFLSAKGKTTPVFTRLSTVVLPKGSADTARDVRGFAVKFYTEEGNYDLVGIDFPVFFIRDAMLFPDLIHALKPSPVTNVQESNRFFDFFGARPESTHMLTFLFSDQGTPASFREMDGFGVHAFKWVNARGAEHYVKYHFKSMQGVKNFTDEQAKIAGGMEPAYCTKDMYDAVTSGHFPSWELQVQIVPAEELRSKFDFDPLDATKDWPASVVPFQSVGMLTLNRMPDNFFQMTEQVAFNTGSYVPGIEPSEDKLLQGRNFSYSDTQRHRLGPNYQQLPINQPVVTVRNENQDGLDNHGDTKGDINYQPSLRDPQQPKADPRAKAPAEMVKGRVQQEGIMAGSDFKQAGERLRAMSKTDRDHTLKNFMGECKKVKDPRVLTKLISNLYQADAEFGRDLAQMAGVELAAVQKAAAGH